MFARAASRSGNCVRTGGLVAAFSARSASSFGSVAVRCTPGASASGAKPLLRRLYSTEGKFGDRAQINPKDFEITESAPERAAPLSEQFPGVATKALDVKVSNKLQDRLNEADIEIRPDGLIYLPEIKYRRILNSAIGAGAWALVPRQGTAICKGGHYSREWALFIDGRYISQARGDSQYMVTSYPDYGMLDESARSNALMRCCKDLGVGSELWDGNFVSSWKEKHAAEVWAEMVTTGTKRRLWRKKDGKLSFPYKELSGGPGVANVSGPGFNPQAPSVFTPKPPAEGPAAPAASPRKGAKTEDDGDFDINATIPPMFKKFGPDRKWADLINTKEGRDYLKWMAKEAKDKRVAADAQRALDYAVKLEFDREG
jgi:hypothetical protein